MTAYTHYWKNDTWDEQLGQQLEHAASNAFRARGVRKGDRVFVVTIREGQLFVGGRLVVDKVTTQKDAEKLLGTALWTARDHIVARNPLGVLQPVPVPNKIARRLRFVPDSDLVWSSPGELDRQTLRGVRRLSDESAALLDDILAKKATVHVDESREDDAEQQRIERRTDIGPTKKYPCKCAPRTGRVSREP
jgi:hypothetical protein